MKFNRSMPNAPVIPVLVYTDVNEAAAWLVAAFGFRVRLQIGEHRVQMHAGGGAVILREPRPGEEPMRPGPTGKRLGQSVTVRVEDTDEHCRRAREHGARILHEPETYNYGERQYTAEDFAGYTWMFSQSVADAVPEDWGGTTVEL